MTNLEDVEKIKEFLLAGKKAKALDIIFDYVDSFCLKIDNSRKSCAIVDEFGKLLLENFNNESIFLSYLVVTRPFRNILDRQKIIDHLASITNNLIILDIIKNI